MSPLHREIINALIIAGTFISLFGIAEIIHRFIPSKPEISRKFVHFFGGMAALSFPYLLRSHITALILAAGFILILFLSKRREGLKSIFGVERTSFGSILFPLAIYLVFLLGYSTPVLYVIAILTLAVSDVVAALIGKRYGSIKFEFEGQIKTLEGSISFFFITFLCIHLPLLLMTDINRLQSVLIALVISFLVTSFELISLAGSDNIFIPLGTYYILAKMTSYPIGETYRLVAILFSVIFFTLLIFWKVKSVKGSGMVGMMLLNFAAWTLCGFRWFLPLLLSEVLFFAAIQAFTHLASERIPTYHIKSVFYTTIIPAALIFIANALDNQKLMYFPFLVAITAQASLICGFFVSKLYREKGILNTRREFLVGIICSLVSAIIVSILPILFYQRHFQLPSFLILAAASMFAFFFNMLITRVYCQKRGISFEDPARFRIRLVSITAAVLVVLALQALFSGRIENAWIL